MLRKITIIISGLLLIVFLSACGGNDSHKGFLGNPISGIPGGSTDTFDEREKSYLYNLFLVEYYWNTQVPQPFDYAPYTEPQSMIDSLKYDLFDKWSFSLTWQEYDILESQGATGFGFWHLEDFTIYTVVVDSPAQKSGLMRGDKIITINGQPVTDALLLKASQDLNQPTTFGLERGGFPVTLKIIAQEYNYKVISYKVIQSNEGQRVGYLRFDEFTDNATSELETAFTYFKNQNIDKLVVDLRYNPGGAVNTASIFLDKIGHSFNNQPQFSLVWNPQNSYRNETLYFDSNDPNSLTLNKLIFLTTEYSASASELVINAMEPYMHENVVTIGTRTHGKPVGMDGRTNGSYIYFLINFAVENAVGFSNYFDGLPPDCTVEDNDFSHQLGDPNEALLNEALYYIDNNHC
jgi:C-terminal peptidase prc